MTVLELIKELKTPGIVVMPVMTAHDVEYIQIVKTDLIHLLKTKPINGPAPWKVIAQDAGCLTLDVND